ncbi:hypothetical protein BD626DRAFT_408683 [Schizophyllum amplum]|uniref:Phospholipid-transporting ATPase n=1 Tax=Schizophyllum amplum TaxID=97359 RepID=A0A550C4P6_9AGAR|nr:hypothetical protein BD626DRAFT_408683 [Auriculariopsis ampla]
MFKRSQHADSDDEPDNIDPELRLRTVRTAHSAIAESIRSEVKAERRKSRRANRRFFRKSTEKKPAETPKDDPAAAASSVPGLRRNIYVNCPLPASEVDQHGEPLARYVRNKVRTTKYTLLTYLPKNIIFEQFRRIANLFFLTLVVLQNISVFGAPSGSISMLPLVFILTVTAIKDGVEDYRRAQLDEEVNTSASTKLGGSFKNVNQPTDSRSWYEKLLNLNPPGKVTRGVRKLREREASEIKRTIAMPRRSSTMESERNNDSMELGYNGAGRKLDDIQSVDSHSYPPTSLDMSKTSLWSGTLADYRQHALRDSAATLTAGVVDYSKRITGASQWERTLWKKLEVGDIVLLRDNDQVPADIVVLSTSDPDGMCYLETKNLDGETNLKPRKAMRATMSISSEDDIERCSFVIDSEPPHQNLYVYRGTMRYSTPEGVKADPIGINELLLRGCSLRNTQWVVGVVVFTGPDTKIMLNGGATPSKRSKIEKETNFNVAVNFVLLTIMCTISAIFSGLEDGKAGTSRQYFEVGADPSDSSVLNALVTFVSCLIAFQNIVPISLYISIEIVKTIQAYFISQDIDMYYEPYDTACVPKTWNISDDLGQIEYVFSDKTGTLTQNIMEFQKCSVAGMAYGEGITEAQRGAATRTGGTGPGDLAALAPQELNEKLAGLKNQMLSTMERTFKNRYGQPDQLTLVSPKLAQDLAERGPQRNAICAFFRALAVCHSVLADRPDPEQPNYIIYKAESPDEAALVAAARDVGFPFVGKGKDGIEIEVLGQREKYTPLKVLEFNSTRKRMSVAVRAPDGRIILYCKGADSVIYERLRADHDPALKDATAKDMEAFANSGLRTLCIAYKEMDEHAFMEWERVYDVAASATENREDEIDKANELIERDLVILGATALEDKLQEGVPEAIDMLHRAGIKLWILTGDKLQTAIEIGYSCNLLKNEMDVMILSADSMEQARLQIEGGLNKIASVLGPPSFKPKERGFMPGAKASFAVVIDGDTLRFALSPELKPLFLNLGTQCETVVCCRVSPAQKALTVKLVKEGRNAMTLSIGDGANDVAMIQEANIGCGLFGLEGSQAAMSADYAFGQFRFLTKLLLVHGRWSYQRVADMHSNFFYKNVIWTFAMFWFLPFNSFDATYLYQYTFILLYNLVFTSLPVIILGAFDQDINAKAALAYPALYVRGIRGLEYTRTKFWMYMIDGLYQSAVVFFIPYLVWTLGIAVSWNGKTIESLADFGTTVSVAAIFAANCYVGINTHYWTVITFIVVIGSSVVMLLWILVYSFFFSSDFIDEVIILFGELTFWTSVIFAVTVALIPRFVVKFLKTSYSPLDKDIVREMWVLGDLKDTLGIRHRKEKKNRRQMSDAETAPMFRDNHNRSTSEMSQAYEMALTASPRGPPARETYLDTPPLDRGQNDTRDYINPRQAPSPQHSPNHLAPSPLPSPLHLSPTYQPNTSAPPSAFNRASPQSRDSYYSASDLPVPSPLPSPKFMYSNGEVTSTPPTPRSASSSYAQAIPLSQRPPPPRLQPPPPGLGRSTGRPPSTYEEAYGGTAEAYGGTDPAYASHGLEPSNASYSTAQSSWEEDDRPPHSTHSPAHAQPYQQQQPWSPMHAQHYAQQQSQQQQQPYPPAQWQESSSQPNLDVTYDDDRRLSQVSWQGGRAL